MNLNDFFKGIGYDISYTNSEFRTIDQFNQWYKGFVDSFHRYYVYNGEKQVTKNRFSLGMPKRICENFADLLMNERVKITLGTDNHTKIIDEILQANNFFVKASQGIEKTFALGTGCFLLSLDKNKKIKIQFISAGNIYPLTFDSDGIYECAFANKRMKFNKTTKKSEQILDLQVHTFNEFGNYTIRNFRFVDGGNGNLTQVEVDDILPIFETNSDYRWFMPIKPNIINNFDLNSPFGIPIYANSLDVIKAADLTYDSFVNEIQNGRKRLFVTQEAMKVGGDGCFKNAFDPQDVVFYILDGNFSDSKANYVQEVNGQLRVDELTKAIKTHLTLLSIKLGLDSDYFSFEKGVTTKTATEVISENNKTFRTLKKHEQVLDGAIREMIQSIIKIGNQYGLFSIDDEVINIDFDDSIIESKDQERLQDRQDIAIDAQGLVEYRMKWYGEDEQTASAKISDIKNQNNSNTSIEFLDGEIN